VRTQEEKWRVPENDPAGDSPKPDPDRAKPGRTPGEPVSPGDTTRAELIYCGLCGALNPASNYYCASCGTTLVDAFHASEGLRVYDRPDTASRLIEIVAAGSELDLIDDPDSPPDFVRVQLSHGRLGYIRTLDVAALASAPGDSPPVGGGLGAPDINTNARGCVTPAAALAALVLLIVLATLITVYVAQSDSAESGIMALAACVTLGPLLIVTIGLYIFARGRDERLEMMAEAEADAKGSDDGR
jgi:hypothetical protein